MYFEHPKQVCMTYFEHFKLSMKLSYLLGKGSFKALVHAFIPDKYITSTSDLVSEIQNIIKESHANIVTVSPEYFVIEKTGFRNETDRLYQDLAPFGLLQFVRSGRISVTKSKMGISEILKKFK